MYDRRLSRLFLFFAGLLLVVLIRCYALQVRHQGNHAVALERRLTTEYHVHARRGDILYADGTPMATNQLAYTVDIDLRAFDAHRWRCGLCRTVATKTNKGPVGPSRCGECGSDARQSRHPFFVDVDAGRGRFACPDCGHLEDVRTTPPDPPESCRSCRADGTLELIPLPDVGDLAQILGVPEAEVVAGFVRVRRSLLLGPRRRLASYPLVRRISREAAAELSLSAEQFPGITARAERERWTDEAVAQVAGDVRGAWAEDVDELCDPARVERGERRFTRQAVYRMQFGRTGLESEFDAVLRGDPGVAVRKRKNRREFEEDAVLVDVRDGFDVRTTLRRDVQLVANEIVAQAEYAAAAVVLRVSDGAVVAIASKSDDGYHHAVTNVMPGSVYKIVPAFAALESGVSPDARFNCGQRGHLPGSGRKYNCLSIHHGADLLTAFEKSCNYYFAVQAEAVGIEAMQRAAARLGLDRAEFVHLRGTLSGLPFAPGREPYSTYQGEKWFEADLHMIAMGQGKASTSPLQVATMYARLASGGRRVRPYLIESTGAAGIASAGDAGDGIVGPHPETFEIDPVIARYAPLVREAARRVVLSGTARGVALLQDLSAAGKSGTAEVDVIGPGGTRERFNSPCFVGYAPHDDPQYVAVVVMERMRDGHGGSDVGPLAARLLQAALR